MTSDEQPLRFGDYVVMLDAAGEPAILGQGATSVVYKARDRELNRIVALKVVRGGLVGKDEAELLANINHESIPQIYRLGSLKEGGFYYAMELLEGMTLADHLAGLREDGQRMSAAEALRLLRSPAEGLQLAHSKEAFHRDLKPENLIVIKRSDESLQLKMIDFGSLVRGTPDYASIEQLEDPSNYAVAGWDIYALGSCLWEMLVGRPPFQPAGERLDAKAVLDRKRSEEPDWAALRDLDPGLPLLLRRLLHSDEDERIRHAGELLGALAEIRLGDSERLPFRPVTPISIHPGDLDQVERSAAIRTSPFCTHYLVRHPKHGRLALLLLSGHLELTRQELERRRRLLASWPLESLRATYDILPESGGGFTIVTEPWRKEDSLNQLIAQRPRAMSQAEFRDAGLRLLFRLGATVDQAKEGGLPPLDLSRQTITLEGANGDLLAAGTHLRISPWCFACGPDGGDDEPSSAAATLITTTVTSPNAVQDPLMFIGALAYELLGGNPSKFTPQRFQKIPHLPREAGRMLRELCEGGSGLQDGATKWLKAFEGCFDGAAPPEAYVRPARPITKRDSSLPDPRAAPEPPVSSGLLDPEIAGAFDEMDRLPPGLTPVGGVASDAPPAPRKVSTAGTPEPTKPATLVGMPAPAPKAKSKGPALGSITVLLVALAAVAYAGLYWFKPGLLKDLGLPILEDIRQPALTAAAAMTTEAGTLADADDWIAAIEKFIEADARGETDAGTTLARKLETLRSKIASGSIAESAYAPIRAALAKAIAVPLAAAEAKAVDELIADRIRRFESATKAATVDEQSGRPEESLRALRECIDALPEFERKLCDEIRALVARLDLGVIAASDATSVKALMTELALLTSKVPEAGKWREGFLDHLSHDAIKLANQAKWPPAFKRLLQLKDLEPGFPKLGTGIERVATLLDQRLEKHLVFNVFHTGDSLATKEGISLYDANAWEESLDHPVLTRAVAHLQADRKGQVALLEKSTSAGDVVAMGRLGRLIHPLLATDPDAARSFKSLEQAWSKGDHDSGPTYARALFDGIGTPVDTVRARAVIDALNAGGHASGESRFVEGRIKELEGDIPAALALYVQATETWDHPELLFRNIGNDIELRAAVKQVDPFQKLVAHYGAKAPPALKEAARWAEQGGASGSSYAAYTYSTLLGKDSPLKTPDREAISRCFIVLWADLGDQLAQGLLREKIADAEEEAKKAPDLGEMKELENRGVLEQAGGWPYLRALKAFKKHQESEGQSEMSAAAGQGHPQAIRWCDRNGVEYKK